MRTAGRTAGGLQLDAGHGQRTRERDGREGGDGEVEKEEDTRHDQPI